MDVIETLQAMKNELLERGWCQLYIHDLGGKVCLVGSYVASKESMAPWKDVVKAFLSVEKVEQTGGIVNFNDIPGRTFNEVLDVIDDAILNVKEGESNDLN